jgi:hypothetical protein
MKTFLIIFSAFPAFAAITNIQVSGTTPTQALISYDAPGGSACTIKVSESPAFSPLVHDVDESLFPGSSSDLRPGSLSSGPHRVAVIGKHGMAANGGASPFLAADGNRYSRALQANTLHYYQIQCGTDTASGTFTTNTIPLGNTYAEPLASDPTNPGSYTWPTVTQTGSRSESFTDPNTGTLVKKITLPTESAPSGGVVNLWPTGGMQQMCSHLLSQANGHSYDLCDVWGTAYPTLVSIETDTGTAYPLTRILIPYGQLGCTTGVGDTNSVVFSITDPLAMYFTSVCNVAVGTELFMAKWTGPLNVAQNVNVNDPSFYTQPYRQLSLITPNGFPSLLAAYDSRFNSAQQAAFTNVAMAGLQQGNLVFQANAGQDFIGWIFVFNPGNNQTLGSGGTGAIVAAMPTFASPVNRWCSQHTLENEGDNSPWIGMSSNSMGHASAGNWAGPYYVVASANDGTGTTIHLAATNGSYEPQSDYLPTYLQDAAVGDDFWVGNVGYGEPIEIVSKDTVNHTWTVIRGNNLGQSKFILGSDITPQSYTATSITTGTRLYAACRGVSFSSTVSSGGALWYWNYVNDPSGTSITYPAVNGTTSNQVVENYRFTGGHYITRGRFNATGSWSVWDTIDGTPGYDLVNYSNGGDFTTPGPKTLNMNPAFAGVYPPGIADTYETHPSYDQMAAPISELGWFTDAIPFINASDARYYSGTGTLVGGQTNTYKMSGVPTLHRKQLTTLASCGAHPLVDISSPTTGNVISDSTTYTYCVANAANECRTGASVGDMYLNCPSAANLTCNTNASAGPVDICIGDSWAYANGAVQVLSTSTDLNGAGTRFVSQLFATHHNEFMYDNVHSTADAKWMLFGTKNLTGTIEAYMAKLPPFPAAESTRRDTFIPIGVTVSNPAKPMAPPGLPPRSGRPLGTNAIVEFGYAENGDPQNFYCTTRREACVAQSSAIDESQPFYYETTEAAAISGLRCELGCTIAIPALAGRVLYYRVTFRDSLGGIVSRQQMAVRAVP